MAAFESLILQNLSNNRTIAGVSDASGMEKERKAAKNGHFVQKSC